MDIFVQDIINQLNHLCVKYQTLQEYFSKNNSEILEDLKNRIQMNHNEYDINDMCQTHFEREYIADNKNRNKIYAFIYVMTNELGFYELLQMYRLDHETYKKLENEAYEYYYQYATEHQLSSQVDRTKIGWKEVKAYLEKDQTRITEYFSRK